MLIVTVENVVK